MSTPQPRSWICLAIWLLFVAPSLGSEPLPQEPVEIGPEPQFVLDNYLIDNYWAIKYHTQIVRRVFHAPVKHEGNPLIAGRGGYVCVVKDDQAGVIRMWYQASVSAKRGESKYAVAYAESKDGIQWDLPKLGLFPWEGSNQNNVVWIGPKKYSPRQPASGAPDKPAKDIDAGALAGRASSGFVLLDIPDRDRRGYRYLMTYNTIDGLRIIGSHDGIHWDPRSDTPLKRLHSDTQNSPVYDPARDQYAMYCRAKHIYRTFKGEILDTGESRRIARITNKSLWDPWDGEPQNVLVPDEVDFRDGFNAFYGMPARYYGRMFWGMLWLFKYNDDIHTELAWSRDGCRFDRMPERPKFVARGPEGSWDAGMAFGSSHWIEMGDQWWFYYAGWDGPHGTVERTPGIGLATLRKEGFFSMRGPKQGGVLATRKILWPGGPLLVNADAHQGELKIRVTDAGRKPLPGLNYDDFLTFSGDCVAHEARWKQQSIADLAGQVVRLEFFLKDADLYTFRAAPRGECRLLDRK